MNIMATPLPGVIVIEPRVFEDTRGFLFEQWHQERYAGSGLGNLYVQDNLSFSRKGVLRGLHLQNPNPQAKLICVINGEIFDVTIDARVGSPTFGRWVGNTLSADNRRQVFVPEGFAHGFCVTSQTAAVMYKCTSFYDPGCEVAIAWNDPDIGITWPLDKPILSEKDARAPRLRQLVTDSKLPALQHAA